MSNNLKTNYSKNICIFPGSFKSFHRGHQHILVRAASIFHKVIVLVVNNEDKNNAQTLKQRFNSTKKVIRTMNLNNVEVNFYDGYTVEYMRKVNCKLLIRGIRNDSDLFYEQKLAKAYLKSDPSIEILYFLNRL